MESRALANPPGATGALVCGILGIVTCWIPVVGLVLAIIGIVLGAKGKRAVREEPDTYTPGGIRVGGFVCGIVGAVLSAIYTAIFALALLVVAGAVDENSELGRQLREQMQKTADEMQKSIEQPAPKNR